MRALTSAVWLCCACARATTVSARPTGRERKRPERGSANGTLRSKQHDEFISKLVAELGLDPGRPAPGVLFHWAASTDDGMRAVDAYESREAVDRLVQDHIGPIAGALGLPLPDITEFEVHNLLAQ